MVLTIVPWGDDPIFEWDEYNEVEIYRHRVTCFEVEECFENPMGQHHIIKLNRSPINMEIVIELKEKQMVAENYLLFFNIKVVR